MPLNMAITALSGGQGNNGIALQVKVLTGAADLQTGAAAGQAGTAAHQASITTTVTGSQVYASLFSVGTTAYTANADTTLGTNLVEGFRCFGSGSSTAATGTPGAITIGASAPSSGGSCALLEILPFGTITEDASSPAAVEDPASQSVTTATFNPPGGAWLVAMVQSSGSAGTTTMAMSGGGLVWYEMSSAADPNGGYAGIWIAQVGIVTPDDPLITATASGATFNGILMRIKVLTGARPAAAQTGAIATQSATAAHQASITTTTTGSVVYGGIFDENLVTFVANASTTLIDNVPDATNSNQFGSCRTTAVTGTPGAVTVGATAGTDGGDCALAEILPSGTIAEDASGPAPVSTVSGITVSQNVQPPPGSLMVVLVTAAGVAGIVNMTVSGGGLPWRELVAAHASSMGYAGVWVADAPAPVATPPARPGPAWRHHFRHPQQPMLPSAAAAAVPPAAAAQRGFPVRAPAAPVQAGRIASRRGIQGVTGPQVRAAAGPVRARIPLPVRGGQVTRRAGVLGTLGPALKALASAVAGRLRGLPSRGRTAGHAGTYGGAGGAVKPVTSPARAQGAAARGGSVTRRAGTLTVAGPQAGPPVYPPGRPVQARQLPQRGGHVTRTAGPYAGTGPAIRPLREPVTAQPAPHRGGSVTARAGTFTLVILGAGPPVCPLHGPVQARRLPQRGGSTSSRAGTYGRTGPAVKPPAGPVKAQPAPQRGGRAASRAGTFTFVSLTSGPPVYPLHGPAEARRLPQHGGSTAGRRGVQGVTGAPVKPLSEPVKAQAGPQRGGQASHRAGTYTAVSLTTGPPIYPPGHPVQARRQAAQGGRVIRAAGTYAGTGAPAIPLRQPAGIQRRQPPPPARGRAAAQRGPWSGTGPPAIPLRHPVRGQPAKPLLTGRAASRAGLYVFIPPPPFTVGTLTGTDAPGSVLTAAGAANALTGGTASQGTLTASDARTGGAS